MRARQVNGGCIRTQPSCCRPMLRKLVSGPHQLSIAVDCSYMLTTSSTGMTLNDKTVVAEIVSPGDLRFTTLQAVRAADDAPLPDGGSDLPNTGVTVLAIDVPPGNQTVSVTLTPLWANDTSISTPKLVPLNSWSLKSHDPPSSLLSSPSNNTSDRGDGGDTASGTGVNGTDTQNGQNQNQATSKNSARRNSNMGLYMLSVFFALSAFFYPLL